MIFAVSFIDSLLLEVWKGGDGKGTAPSPLPPKSTTCLCLLQTLPF